MPANKNALLRYKILDKCLRNKYRKYTIQDLVDACSDALNELEQIEQVSLRTIQGDLRVMRDEKCGYGAPIEVYERKYYRYSDPEFSITEQPLTSADIETMTQAVNILRQFEGYGHFAQMSDVIGRLQDNLACAQGAPKIVDFESNKNVKGLDFLTPLYDYISNRQTLVIEYQSFSARAPHRYRVFPHLLKEYRNRWFIFCTERRSGEIYNFALDRILSIDVAEDIPYQDNPNFDPSTYFDNIVGVSRWGEPVEVTFWATREQACYISTKPIHPSQKVVESNCLGGSRIFKVFVEPNWEFISLMLGFGPGVRILSPNNVVRAMKRKIRDMGQIYEADLKLLTKKNKKR